MPNAKAKFRKMVRDNLDAIMMALNAALRGEKLDHLEHVIKRIGRGGQLPHWYAELKSKGTIVNLDGKTIGSILEMLLVQSPFDGKIGMSFALQWRYNFGKLFGKANGVAADHETDTCG